MISVTKLSSYIYCPRKLYLVDVMKLIEPPKAALLKGTIKHSTFEVINNTEQALVESVTARDFNQILTLYVKKMSSALRSSIINKKNTLKKFSLEPALLYRELWPMFMKESERRSLNLFNFISEHNIFGPELWESLFPKIKSEIRVVSQTLGLRGIIDQIHIYPDRIIPFELKSGSAPKHGVWPGHRIQIAAYMLLFNEKYSCSIDKGFIHYLDYDKQEPVIMNPFLKQEVIDLKNKVERLLNSDHIPRRCVNKNKCNACSLKNLCFDL